MSKQLVVGKDKLGRTRKLKPPQDRKYKTTPPEHKKIVMEHLNKTNSIAKTLLFFHQNHPEVAKTLSKSKIMMWKKRSKNTPKKRGRPSILDAETKKIIIEQIATLSNCGAPLTSTVCQPIIRNIINKDNPSSQVKVSKSWVNKFFKQNDYVPRKSTSTSELPINWCNLVMGMNVRLSRVISKYHIPAELVINLDQLGLDFLSPGKQTRAKRGSKKVVIIGSGDKRKITCVPVVAASGDFICIQMIFTGKTERVHPQSRYDLIMYSHSSTHWSTIETMKELIDFIALYRSRFLQQNVYLPMNQQMVLNLDCWKVHISEEFRDWIKASHPYISLIYVPGGCTGVAQVCDLVVNKKLKDMIKQQFQIYITEKLVVLTDKIKEGISIEKLSLKTKELRPLLAKWMVEVVTFFLSDPGKKLILEGFDKAGILQCFDRDFQTRSFFSDLPDDQEIECETLEEEIEIALDVGWLNTALGRESITEEELCELISMSSDSN